ncbi:MULTISPECIES: hypothetical protein [unclassified Nonomuraea]|uniref:hypothetical protein n=1 Tax=unclassified Nonomuraea TaxID=2593643 RepID=UPI0034099452
MGNQEPEPQTDPFGVPPYKADKFQGDGRVHEPSVMRAIAEALSQNLQALEKPGVSGRALVDGQPGAAQFGEWADARAFGSTAGRDGAGQKFGRVHSEFVKAYKDVIAAIEASAGNHAEADTRNEGV